VISLWAINLLSLSFGFFCLVSAEHSLLLSDIMGLRGRTYRSVAFRLHR
jgi:hypothetical protein